MPMDHSLAFTIAVRVFSEPQGLSGQAELLGVINVGLQELVFDEAEVNTRDRNAFTPAMKSAAKLMPPDGGA